MKVALVHDYLREYGGAERVLEALHEMFPQAPIYTAYFNPKGLGPHAQRIKDWNIKTSWLQNIPFADKLISPFRVFAPMIFESFDFSDYDLVISSCSIYFSKAIITDPQTLHLSYIHTPPRYLYGYTTSFNYKKNPLTRFLGEIANFFLRIYDFETSQRPDVLIANSDNVASRIKKFYRRDCVVIYPPVDVEEIGEQARPAKEVKSQDRDYFLSLSRLVRGKGVDLIIQACNQAGVKLKVVGAGPQLKNLKSIAGQTVKFIGEVSDQQRVKLYQEAKALIVASEDEDFGITSVEAQAAGTPVIAARSGGYLETVQDGKTGVFFDPDSVDSLVRVIREFDQEKFNPKDCQQNSEKFSKDKFSQKMLELIKLEVKS